ncbi:CvpA family protein [Magnetovibrio sp.]|uniref:CvpA family protein n=1 Tax=Magnetovibrio sp. TaxID=2024836 RepID=UPI002F94E68F
MHWIDILVIGTLLISGAFAYARGFVHEVLSIAGWIGAVFATLYGTPVLEHFTLQFIEDPFIATLVTGILVFVVTLAVLSITTRRISRGVKESALGPLDRALGFLFGLLRGAVIVALVWIGYTWMVPADEQPEWIYEARTLPLIIQGADMLKALAPATEEPDPNAPATKDKPAAKPAQKDQNQSLLDKAINAIPKAPAGSTTDGYGQKERSEMDRLFETSQ